MKHEPQRQVKPAVKPHPVVHRAQAKPATRTVEPMAKNPVGSSAPKSEAPIVGRHDLDAEAIRFRSTLVQVEADLEANQVETARIRIRAALVHGTDLEPTPQE